MCKSSEAGVARFKEIYPNMSCSKCSTKTADATVPWTSVDSEEALMEGRYQDVNLVCPACE